MTWSQLQLLAGERSAPPRLRPAQHARESLLARRRVGCSARRRFGWMMVEGGLRLALGR